MNGESRDRLCAEHFPWQGRVVGNSLPTPALSFDYGDLHRMVLVLRSHTNLTAEVSWEKFPDWNTISTIGSEDASEASSANASEPHAATILVHRLEGQNK